MSLRTFLVKLYNTQRTHTDMQETLHLEINASFSKAENYQHVQISVCCHDTGIFKFNTIT